MLSLVLNLGRSIKKIRIIDVRVSMVRLLKYAHRHPPIIILFDHACRLSPPDGPAGKN